MSIKNRESNDAPARTPLSEWLAAETAKADGARRLDCTVEELSSPFGVAFLRAHLTPAAMDCLCHPDSRLVSSYNHTYARFGGCGWGENGQSRLKFNYRTGEAAAVMVNQNPGVEQSESGVEWLINNGAEIG